MQNNFEVSREFEHVGITPQEHDVSLLPNIHSQG